MQPRIVTVALPEYRVEEEPEYSLIGPKVDRAIEANFKDGMYLYRAIGVDDHPGLTVDDLVSIILSSGTDKYDSMRKAVGHEEFSAYDYDLQCGSFTIENSTIVEDPQDDYPSLFGDTVHDFYANAPYDRGYPVRIDILTLYDPCLLERAPKLDMRSTGVNVQLEKYLYRFKDRDHKHRALRGIVKILR